MQGSIADVMEKVAETGGPIPAVKHDGPTREHLENSIKAFHNFRTAVRSGTFAGAASIHVAALLGLLDAEHDNAVKNYEAAFPVDPQWGKKHEGV